MQCWQPLQSLRSGRNISVENVSGQRSLDGPARHAHVFNHNEAVTLILKSGIDRTLVFVLRKLCSKRVAVLNVSASVVTLRCVNVGQLTVKGLTSSLGAV